MSLGRWPAEFGGEDQVFDVLPLGIRKRLEASRGIGVWALYQKLLTRQCSIDDYREVIRLGLVGGGTDEAEANKLVKAHFDPAPWETYLGLALDIVEAAMMGDDKLKKVKAELAAQDLAVKAPQTQPS